MNANRMTDKRRILEALPWEDGIEWAAVHSLSIPGVSENTAATRLSELQAAGLVVGEWAEGSRFKIWARRRVPVAPRIKVKRPSFRVVGVEGDILTGKEYVTVEAPAGTFRAGMTVRL